MKVASNGEATTNEMRQRIREMATDNLLLRLFEGGFTAVCIAQSSFTALQEEYERRGTKVYILEPEGVHDDTTFLLSLLRAFNAAHNLQRPNYVNWPGASDYIESELLDRPERNLALLWKGAQPFLNDRLQLFMDALEFLHDIGNGLSRNVDDAGYPSPIGLRIVLFGEGTQFPRWP